MGFAETFKALSDPVRREILMMLREKPLSAGEIGSNFAMTGATISYHLNILKKADLVRETREKNFIYYDLNVSVVEEVMLWLSQLKGETVDEVKREKNIDFDQHYHTASHAGGNSSMEKTASGDGNPF